MQCIAHGSKEIERKKCQWARDYRHCNKNIYIHINKIVCSKIISLVERCRSHARSRTNTDTRLIWALNINGKCIVCIFHFILHKKKHFKLSMHNVSCVQAVHQAINYSIAHCRIVNGLNISDTALRYIETDHNWPITNEANECVFYRPLYR